MTKDFKIRIRIFQDNKIFSRTIYVFSHFPCVFQDWKIGHSFSRISRFSRTRGNPVYFMLAILSKKQNKARFTYPDRAHLFIEFNMLTWSGERWD